LDGKGAESFILFEEKLGPSPASMDINVALNDMGRKSVANSVAALNLPGNGLVKSHLLYQLS
jgi:hypothetical protein